MLSDDKMKFGQSERAAYPDIYPDIRIREPSFIQYPIYIISDIAG
jgi:hypothetical protein